MIPGFYQIRVLFAHGLDKTIRGMTRICGLSQMGNQTKHKRSGSSTLRYLNSSAHGMVPVLRAGGGDVPLDAGHYWRRECMATRFHCRNLAGHCKEEDCSEGGKSYEGGIATDTNFGKWQRSNFSNFQQTSKQWEIGE
jgi:hypothetical protein